MELVVGIDTSKASGKRSRGKRFVCAVIGSRSDIARFVRDVLADLRRTGFNTVHWSDLFASARDKVFGEYRDRLPEYSLRALVFPVVREGEKRDFYLGACPWVIGRRLSECVTERLDSVSIVVDTDFESLAPQKAGVAGSSVVFLERLVSRMGSEVAMCALNARCHGSGVHLRVVTAARELEIEGRVGSQADVEVQAADLVLGLFALSKERKRSVLNVVECELIKG